LVSATAQLEQRLGAAQLELRKLGSERHTLRARLRREVDRSTELASALRAEGELRQQAAEEHQAALSGLRARLSDLETTSRDEVARLTAELARAKAIAERSVSDVEAVTAELASLRAASKGQAERTAKSPDGLRCIRGIGPAYQRVLQQLGITRVEQIAAWTTADAARIAERLKIRPERIAADDWIGQARRLTE
jgi:predicted flap endonuclease-1-like 5' DNA nuclease